MYTDLALEMAEFLGSGQGGSDLPGVRMDVSERPIPGGTVKVTWIEITNEEGERAMGRTAGNYVTAECEAMKGDDVTAHEGIIGILADLLGGLEVVRKAENILVAGLGNRYVTPDALGPRVISKTLITRHIMDALPDGASINAVAALAPGVMGTTGVETGEIIKGVAEHIKPDLIIAVDALAARRASRVNAAIQFADTGIAPGGGMGNKRKAINKETMGAPVVAIGVPTVVDAATLVNDTIDLILGDMAASLPEGSDFFNTIKSLEDGEKYSVIKRSLEPYAGNMFVTPKDVDAVINRLSNIIANSINIALHPGMTKEDINRYMY